MILALIEHGSRPAALALVGVFFVAWLFWVKEPLLDILRAAQYIKFGAIEFQIRERALSEDLSKELNALSDLDDEQLQLFLAIGKDKKEVKYTGEEVTKENLLKLQQAGLVTNVEERGANSFGWEVTDNAVRLHEIIRGIVYSGIRKSGNRPQ